MNFIVTIRPLVTQGETRFDTAEERASASDPSSFVVVEQALRDFDDERLGREFRAKFDVFKPL